MAQMLDGKALSEILFARVAEEAKALPVQPCLAVIIVGEDPASKIYVANKRKNCEQVGFRSLEYALPADTGQAKLLALIDQLNRDDSVHGILCQSPLPAGYGYDEPALCRAVSPRKDVDCFHPENVGKLALGEPGMLPCTPAGILELLDGAGISLEGKHVVIVGRSIRVGKPMVPLALMRSATVTICHSKTQNLAEITRQADVLVVAIGRLRFITADMVKQGAVVVDVGMNRAEGKKVRGDVDFDAVEPIAGYITPVPGGVGPMTRAMLMQNTLTAAKAAT
ncbi:MAG: bifunctional 5,10-methylene-tetrahydrofolate dehydrogenase/5,10-methylene-tetrahydrofolate cyclohydrolase [Oscillospiraceae bacterium]|jgi:methylenetetrahydrofolate dehydrogenase (NADP+)/methenyltetrahydrofolate cyclohydrolase|nr:bifunctional 5,10-methylene-tetrahydrofolate dehydrogenase/5,10-methylene-tetrahydrofolate cyclohydrolase [Oscillospiraceae bacterium]